MECLVKFVYWKDLKMKSKLANNKEELGNIFKALIIQKVMHLGTILLFIFFQWNLVYLALIAIFDIILYTTILKNLKHIKLN